MLPAYATLLTLLLCMQATWIWESLYFQRQQPHELAFAFAAMIAVVSLVAMGIYRGLRRERALQVMNLLLVLTTVYVAARWVKQADLLGEAANPLIVRTGWTLLAIGCAWMGWKLAQQHWQKIYQALIMGGLMFTLSPLIIAHTLSPTVYWPTHSARAATDAPVALPEQNTIILLLDELSAGAAEPFVTALIGAGLHVTQSSLTPAGRDTLQVVPSMFARKPFHQAAVCGPTQLCSGTQVLDFAKIKAASDKIDVVGFYHRYCEIQGLRSCQDAPLFPKKPALGEMACAFPLLRNLNTIDCIPSDADRERSLTMRDELERALWRAPFWEQGGVLYAHLFAPHPNMGTAVKSLRHEYDDNLAEGAAVIRQIADKARDKFGENFRIIAFSDHPLRVNVWCKDDFYKEKGCEPAPNHVSTQVPLILASPKPPQALAALPKTNQAVFDLLVDAPTATLTAQR